MRVCGDRRSKLVALTIVLVLVVGGVALWAATRSSADDAPSTQESAVTTAGHVGGDPGGHILASLRRVAAAIPSDAHVAYRHADAPHWDSCDGMAGTFGWNDVVYQASFTSPLCRAESSRTRSWHSVSVVGWAAKSRSTVPVCRQRGRAGRSIRQASERLREPDWEHSRALRSARFRPAHASLTFIDPGSPSTGRPFTLTYGAFAKRRFRGTDGRLLVYGSVCASPGGGQLCRFGEH
jgi:hypothetical protein